MDWRSSGARSASVTSLAIPSAKLAAVTASTGLGQDRVDLADGLLQAPHGGELLHRLDGRKLALDRHPGLPAADLLDGHPHRRRRELAVRRAVLVCEAVAED